jgi:Reverse transcriptase (RNA-dependent DNA polymerase)/GAG-pre-integrase domain
MDEYENTPTTAVATAVRTATVVLTGPDNWHEWLYFISNSAIEEHIWEYVNPDLETQPILPIQPALPSDPEDDQPESQNKWQREKFKYEHRRKDYEKTVQALKEFNKSVERSIDTHFFTHFYRLNAKTGYARMKALKDNIAPTDRGRELTVTTDYETLKRVQKRMNIDLWLKKFRMVCNEAEILHLACVSNDRAQVDFLNAVKVWEHSWAETKLTLLLDAEKAPTLDSLMSSFEKKRKLSKGEAALAKAKSIQPSVSFAGASLQGRNDAPGPCLCKEKHWYNECPYLNEGKRPSNWSPNRDIKTQIDAEMSDPNTRERIQKSIQRRNQWLNNPDNVSNRANKQSYNKNKTNQGNRSSLQIKSFKNRNKDKDKNFSSSQSSSNNEKGESDPLNFNNAAAASASTIEALRRQWILDSGSDIHITNDKRCLTDLREKRTGKVIAGATRYTVEAVGTARIQVQTPNGPAIMTLPDVAYIPHFMTNVVSLSLLIEKNTHWNTEDGCLRRNSKKIAIVRRFKGHWTVSDDCPPRSTLTNQVDELDEYEGIESLFSALTVQGCRECNSRLSFAAEKSVDDNISYLWHARLGHPGIDALAHLNTSTLGISKFVLDKTICETCALAKATEIVSRSAYREIREEHPFHRVSCDLVELVTGFNGDRLIVHFQDFQTGFSLVFNEPGKGGSAFRRIFRLFLSHVKTQYRQDVRIIRIDGETSVDGEVKSMLQNRGITLEPSVPYTPAQNGHAERTGRTLLTKARALRLHSRLPHDLWPELVRTAAYLMNRTPVRRLGWKTPHEALFGEKPTLKHLRVVGCKAYVFRHKIPRGNKLDARARIGYLVGYDATNIWRIWDPSGGYTIIRARSVRFDEGHKYDPDDFTPNAPLNTVETLAETMDTSAFDIAAPSDIDSDESDVVGYDPDAYADTIEVTRPDDVRPSTQRGNLSELPTLTPASSLSTTMTPQSLNTPPSTPETRPTTASPVPPPSLSSGRVTDDENAAIQAGNTAPRASQISTNPHPSLILPEGSKRKKRRLAQFAAKEDEEYPTVQVYHAFAALLTDSTRVNNRQSPRANDDPLKLKIHRDTLPPEPKNWRDLEKHQFGKYFIQAGHTEMQTQFKRGTFKEIDRQRNHRPLPLLWVFKYKFDTDGYLVKFKARLCVRGDLQVSLADNYAATLAVKVFRALMALTAAFDLEIIQLDAVNAFLNSEMDEDVTVQYPPGFPGNNKVLKLLKALYGLKQAPLLWHNHLVGILTKLGLKRVSSANCVLTSDWLILFFYVDDIILLFTEENRPNVEEFLTQLKGQLELRQMDEADWFLGIRIIRERNNRKLWLCQDSYIEKVAARFNIDPRTRVVAPTPLPTDIPGPFDGEATAAERHGYQTRVGSINFAATTTRPDIAKACSVLSQYLRNPSPEHLRVADRVIAYLANTKYLALEYCGLIDQSGLKVYPGRWIESFPFECYSDAAFADNRQKEL